MRRIAGLWCAVALVGLTAGAAGCSASAEEDGPPVLDPGGPGDEPVEISEEDIAEGVDISHNEADVDFMHRMIVHHGQAIEMSEMAEDRTGNDDINAFATRIAAAQESEVELMEAWLESNVYAPGRDSPAHQNYCGLAEDGGHHGGGDCVEIDHDHEGMQGMLTPAEMEELRGTRDAAFDELFVESMVSHHEGGIAMAEEIQREGEHPIVYDMATGMAIEQSAEITRLQDIVD